jgi:hypothetical protein
MKFRSASIRVGATIALALWTAFTAAADDKKKNVKPTVQTTNATKKQNDSSKTKALPLNDVKMTSRETSVSEAEEARRTRRGRRRLTEETSQDATLSAAEAQRRRAVTTVTSQQTTTSQTTEKRRRRRHVAPDESAVIKPDPQKQ